MKQYRYILTLILILTFGNTFAHSDFYIVKDFENVKVRIKTGYKYEEIEKVFLIGQLADSFAIQLNYSEPIFLDFNHYYVGNCEPNYFISYDRGKIQNTWSGVSKEDDFLKDKSIVVRQVARQFDSQTTLKLLEYAIINIKKIKSSQNELIYNKNYCQWRINSIDTTLIKGILNEPNSNQINNILSLKIERPFNDFVSYYLQNNKYTVFFSGFHTTKDTALIILDNVYQFYENRKSLIFDTDTSFYYIDGFAKKVSRRHVIQNTNGNYRPYGINYIGNEKFSIHFRYYPKENDPENAEKFVFEKERTLIYLMEKDVLIQNLDELLKNHIPKQSESTNFKY